MLNCDEWNVYYNEIGMVNKVICNSYTYPLECQKIKKYDNLGGCRFYAAGGNAHLDLFSENLLTLSWKF